MTKTIPSHETKVCTTCGIEKPRTEFGPNKRARDKRLARCRTCSNAWARIHRAVDPITANAKHRAWNKRRQGLMSPDQLTAYRASNALYQRDQRDKRKLKIFEAYGGAACACCGESEIAFLSMDHVDNNGCAVRRSGLYVSGSPFYQWLIKNHFPPGFQVLCMNCQFGKKCNKGICPHKSRGVTTRTKVRRAKRLEAHRTP